MAWFCLTDESIGKTAMHDQKSRRPLSSDTIAERLDSPGCSSEESNDLGPRLFMVVPLRRGTRVLSNGRGAHCLFASFLRRLHTVDSVRLLAGSVQTSTIDGGGVLRRKP